MRKSVILFISFFEYFSFVRQRNINKRDYFALFSENPVRYPRRITASDQGSLAEWRPKCRRWRVVHERIEAVDAWSAKAQGSGKAQGIMAFCNLIFFFIFYGAYPVFEFNMFVFAMGYSSEVWFGSKYVHTRTRIRLLKYPISNTNISSSITDCSMFSFFCWLLSCIVGLMVLEIEKN